MKKFWQELNLAFALVFVSVLVRDLVIRHIKFPENFFLQGTRKLLLSSFLKRDFSQIKKEVLKKYKTIRASGNFNSVHYMSKTFSNTYYTECIE